MQKSDFDLLMERYVAGKVSEPERRKIEAWLDAMGPGDSNYPALSKDEEERIFQKLTSGLGDISDVTVPGRKTSIGFLQWATRIAACLVIVSAVAYMVRRATFSRGNRPETAFVNDTERLILGDGSLVWLRGESRLQYFEVEGNGSRHAVFEGEGLFEVAKDEAHPFVLQCGDVSIRVLGTSFGIRMGPNWMELTVLTGKVNLSSTANAKGIDVLPREKVIYKTNGGFEKVAATRQEISSIIKDTYYEMEFANTLMGDVIDRLARKFNVSIDLSDPRIRNCRVTVDLTDQSLDQSLKFITEILHVTYTMQGRAITLSGTGCTEEPKPDQR